MVAQSMFQQFFIKFGLPRLLIVNTGSEFRATLEAVAELLYSKIFLFPPESHHAQRCERFHRFLNKVVLIMTHDRGEIAEWHTAYASAQYASNAMPVDMTDIQRSIAAIGREFKFPLDHIVDDPIGIPEEGHGVVECVHDITRFLKEQQQILQVLND
jgi:hypothetical protein